MTALLYVPRCIALLLMLATVLAGCASSHVTAKPVSTCRAG